MHKEILTQDQIELLPLLKEFSGDFGLVGGTAIALHLGHRRSIDFDLFTHKTFDSSKVRNKIRGAYTIQNTLLEDSEELTLTVNGVKLTFYVYPFKIKFAQKLDDIINLPDLDVLAAMKAFALGRRAKWKDYVDLYFVIKEHSFEEISKKAHELFGTEFNEKLFREQLSYFEDVDYSEKVDYIKGFNVFDGEIKQKLLEFSVGETV